jgi:hypothetical protein
MKKQELEQKLIMNGIPNDMYSLIGGLPNEAYCLENNHTHWEVYYSERGLKTNLKKFKSEEEACGYIYELITNQSWMK